eukprot:gene8168-1423_t
MSVLEVDGKHNKYQHHGKCDGKCDGKHNKYQQHGKCDGKCDGKHNKYQQHGEVVDGLLLRCAAPSGATTKDIHMLLQGIGIKDMIDLRSGEELAEDPPESHLFDTSSFVRWDRHWVSGQIHAAATFQRPGASVVRHNVSVLERGRYFRGLLWKVPITSVMSAAAYGVMMDKERARLTLLGEINAGGLGLLYNIILESARPELCMVMTKILIALEDSRPLLFFCKAGKDRTGIIAMLVLSCCGVPENAILSDYVRSDSIRKVALAGIENKPELKGLDHSKFQGAPMDAMESALDYLRSKYGSPRAYLTSIGFGPDRQDRLAEKMLRSQELGEEGSRVGGS